MSKSPTVPISLWLLSGWLVLGGILAALIAINPTHFTSIDSGYYLQSAGNLLAGRGYVIQEAELYIWNGIFPIGYSGLIAIFSMVTSLPLLVSSKLINWLAIGLSAWLWGKRLGPTRADWLLSIWFLGSFLRIAAYTWSETVFLILLAEIVWAFYQLLVNPSNKHSLVLFMLGLGLFVVRYVGGYLFGVYGLSAVLLLTLPQAVSRWSGVISSRTTGVKLVVIFVLGLIGMGIYFWLNSQMSDSPYGGERFYKAELDESLLLILLISLVNEALLIRDFIRNESSVLAWLGFVAQLIWFFTLMSVYKRVTPVQGTDTTRLLQRLFLIFGVTYLVVLFGLRIFSPFDGPNARLMAPFSFCLLFAAILWITELHRKNLLAAFKPFWLFLLLFSWLQLFPQVDLSRKLQQIQQKFLTLDAP